MDTPPSSATVDRRVHLRLAAAWAAAAWEDLWRRLWAPVAAVMAFIGIALTDILPSWPGYLHAAAVIAFAAAIGRMIYLRFRDFRWPTRTTARARLENVVPELHRPLTAVEDRHEGDDSDVSAALWAAHRQRATAVLDRLRAEPPAPGVAALDRRSFRAAAGLLLILGVAGAGSDAGPRLMRALTPSFDSGGGAVSAKLWLTPPGYTNKSPVFLEFPAAARTPAPARLIVPQGSVALVIVTGTTRQTELKIDKAVHALEKVGDDSQRLEIQVPPGNRLELTQRGRAIAGWDFEMLPDLPPEIEFVREPKEAGRGRLRVDYRARDDYGIGRVTAYIKPTNGTPTHIGEPFEVELSTPPFNPKEATAASFLDLTAHPWAGMAVEMSLRIKDQAEQSAESDAIVVQLPERVFNHPVARELVSLRKSLIADFPANVMTAARAVDRILRARDRFGGEPHVVLLLSSVRGRLALGPSPADARPVIDMLWHAAVRIEDGNLVETEQRLAAAEQALREAMERGASPREIDQLVDQLKQALADYTRELAERMPQNQNSALKPEKGQGTISPEDIAATMERLRQMSQMGATEAARKMMSELQDMLQALRQAASSDPGENQDMKNAQEIMKDLQDVTEAQSKMLEESFKKERQQELEGRKPGQKDGDPAAGERQEKLRQKLGDLMGRMGEMAGQIPDAMGEAESAMRKARDRLNSGKPASDAQGQALAALQQSMQQANQQLMQTLSDKGMAGIMPMPGKDREGFDPLGRRTGPDNGEDVELPRGPDAAGVSERVRAILEEIRRRAADRTRPAEEQDYLRRLMKQF